MNDLSLYEKAKCKLRPGDVILFWGRNPLSWLIELFANGPSHSAIVRQGIHQNSDVIITESTIIEDRDGVQSHPLKQRVLDCDGYMAGLRLSDEIHNRIDWFKFYEFIGASEDHVKYDVGGLFEFLLRLVPIIGERAAQEEDKKYMVCSAWVTAVLIKSGVLTGINWNKMRPQDLVEMNIYKDYLPLLGKPKLTRFNSL